MLRDIERHVMLTNDRIALLQSGKAPLYEYGRMPVRATNTIEIEQGLLDKLLGAEKYIKDNFGSVHHHSVFLETMSSPGIANELVGEIDAAGKNQRAVDVTALHACGK